MVARVEQPGCKHDVILVIEGRQGLLKSAMLRVMAGPGRFTDHMPDLASKDAALQLRGIWLLEFAEFDKLDRSDAAVVKAWLSTQVDRIRVPYGRLAEDTPRQSVVAGTINPGDSGYLRDETGNRRIWPVTAGAGWPPGRQIDVAGLAAVRSQLFAEAVARYDAGESWWLDREDLDAAQTASAAERMQVDPWLGRVLEYLDGKDETTMADMLGQAIGKPAGQWSRSDQMRVSAILKDEGWARRRVRVGNAMPWKYFRHPTGEVLPFRSRLSPTSSEFPVEVRNTKISMIPS